MTGVLAGIAILAASAGTPPAVVRAQPTLASASLTYQLPEAGVVMPRAGDPGRRSLGAAAAPAPRAPRARTFEKVLGTVVGGAVGFLAGGIIGGHITQDDDRDDDGISALKGIMIGAPVGGIIGAVVGYKLLR